MDQISNERFAFDELCELHAVLRKAKPNDRSESDRRHAVAITKLEELISWYHTMIICHFGVEADADDR